MSAKLYNRRAPLVRILHLIAPVTVIAVIALTCTVTTGNAQGVVSGPAKVIDGDTIEVQGRSVRLHGIDAPESAQECSDARGRSYRCGQDATRALASLVGRASVSCRVRDRDRYGRLVAVCRRDGVDLNGSMILQGHALAYRQFGADYVSLENAARAQRRGVWQGRFVAPWDWRRTEANASRVRPPAPRDKAGAQGQECAIKGNVSRSGERIHHLPGGQFYGATRISESKGERWFCSESQARAAGWRKSRR